MDTPVHKASSRIIAGSSINKCCLFRHIGQTREALSPPQARGVLFCHTSCMYFALHSNMNDWMFGHYDTFHIALSSYYVINQGRKDSNGDELEMESARAVFAEKS